MGNGIGAKFWVHLDDESKIAKRGTKSRLRWAFSYTQDEKSKDEIIKLQAKEIKELDKKLRVSQISAIEDKDVAELNGWELNQYETKLQKQLKGIAREITKVHQAKSVKRVGNCHNIY